MQLKPVQYKRKPFVVTGYVVTSNRQEMEFIARWCGGELREDRAGCYVQVPVDNAVHENHTKARPGKVVLVSEQDGRRYFKVYNQRILDMGFDLIQDEDCSMVDIPMQSSRGTSRSS